MVGISPDEAPLWEPKVYLDTVSPDAPLLWGLWGLSLIKMLPVPTSFYKLDFFCRLEQLEALFMFTGVLQMNTQLQKAPLVFFFFYLCMYF